jgi:hypothetical protein
MFGEKLSWKTAKIKWNKSGNGPESPWNKGKTGKYWNKLKERLRKEGSESVTNCHQLKMEAADG